MRKIITGGTERQRNKIRKGEITGLLEGLIQ